MSLIEFVLWWLFKRFCDWFRNKLYERLALYL